MAASILPALLSLHRRGKIRNPVARMKGFSVRPTFPRASHGSKCTAGGKVLFFFFFEIYYLCYFARYW